MVGIMLEKKLRRAYAVGDIAYIIRRYMVTLAVRPGRVAATRKWRIAAWDETVNR